jgi:hypothetical protein
VLPQITPATDLGAAAVAGYARRQGTDLAAYIDSMGPVLTPDIAGKEVTGLLTDSGYDQRAYVLTAAGLRPMP